MKKLGFWIVLLIAAFAIYWFFIKGKGLSMNGTGGAGGGPDTPVGSGSVPS